MNFEYVTWYFDIFKALFIQVRTNHYIVFDTHLLDHTVHVGAFSSLWKEPGDRHLQK